MFINEPYWAETMSFMLFDFQIQQRYKKATGYLPFLFEGSSLGFGVWISENTPHPQQANLMSTLWDKIIKEKRFWSRLETDQVSRRHLSIFVRVYYDWLRSEHLGSMAINTFQHNNNNKIIIFNFYLQFYFWDELIDCLWKIRVLWRVVQTTKWYIRHLLCLHQCV